MTELSVCVVNYNGSGRIEACLDALLDCVYGSGNTGGSRSSNGAPEIIVIDNASTDGSAEAVERHYPGVVLLRLPENAGPPAARNRGFAAATGRLVLFVDNDVVVSRECVWRLMAALEECGAAVAMPRVCYAQRPGVIQYDGAGCHPLGLMTLMNANRAVAEAAVETRAMSSVVSACFLVDRHRLNFSELFDEDFFFNYEDHDFGLRCSVAGARLVSVPAAMCYHGSGTKQLSYRPSADYAPQRVYCLIRNRWLILLKVYRLRTLVVLAPVLAVYEMFQLFGVAARGWLGSWLAALGWVLAHPRVIQRKRRAVQRTRCVDDFALFDEHARLPFTADLARNRLDRAAVALLDRLILGYCGLIRRFERRSASQIEAACPGDETER